MVFRTGVLVLFDQVFSLGRVVLYTVFIDFPLPQTLVTTLARNLVKNLAKNLLNVFA